MSGHSKWATTKRAKGVADAKRGAIFTKLAKAITVTARIGGGDPTMNFKLRLAIDLAKAANMPKDNIERAIKRGTGADGGGNIENITYEGFGPAKTAFIVECLTDNRNRSSSNVKHLLTKYGGSFGAPGSVQWLFEQKGVIRVAALPEDLELELIDAGASDIVREDEGVTIYTAPNDLNKVQAFLESQKLISEYAQIEYLAKEIKTLSQEDKERYDKLCSELEDDEDVDSYYSNVKED